MMNRRAMVLCSLLASSVGAWAQAVDNLAPSAVTPKPPPPAAAPVIHGRTAQPKSPRSPEGDKPLNPDKPNLKIRGVLLVRTRAEVLEGGETNFTGLVVRDIPFLNQRDFFHIVQKNFIGRPLTENAIRDLEDAVILYCRSRGKLLVDVILPEQNIEEGVLQLWFLEGHVGKVEVKNEGRKWFKDQFILDHVRLRPGDSLDGNQLNEDLG